MQFALGYFFFFLFLKPIASLLGRDELDLEIHTNFERRGWLPLLEVKHPSPVALIREFYSNLSVHSDDSNFQFVKVG